MGFGKGPRTLKSTDTKSYFTITISGVSSDYIPYHTRQPVL